MALNGLAQLIRTVEVVKDRLNPDLAISGILACRVDARTRHALEVVEHLKFRFGIWFIPLGFGTAKRRVPPGGMPFLWATDYPIRPQKLRGSGLPCLSGSHHRARKETLDMAKRNTIGDNPLDAVIPPSKASQTGVASTPNFAPKPVKERLTVHLPVALIDRVKNAVYWTPGLTLAGLAEVAFTEAMAQLEQERGGPFPPRRSELKGGRPLK